MRCSCCEWDVSKMSQHWWGEQPDWRYCVRCRRHWPRLLRAARQNTTQYEHSYHRTDSDRASGHSYHHHHQHTEPLLVPKPPDIGVDWTGGDGCISSSPCGDLGIISREEIQLSRSMSTGLKIWYFETSHMVSVFLQIKSIDDFT